MSVKVNKEATILSGILQGIKGKVVGAERR